jgi:formylglycine-generating enzyme
VVNVSWNDCAAFCTWLSRKEGKTYRLPTEAEWEYACRAGTRTLYQTGDDIGVIVTVGNVCDESVHVQFPWNYLNARDGYIFTAPVGRFGPNSFGLYDMHGNVSEWCADWYDEDYYAGSQANDPIGPAAGSARVYRGSNWCGYLSSCRSAKRSSVEPDYRHGGIGFRVVLVP